MADDRVKEVVDEETQTEFTFRSTDTNSAVDFQLRNRGQQPQQDGAGTSSAPEDVPPEPAVPEPPSEPEPEPEVEPVAEEVAADGEDIGEVLDVEETDAPLDGDEGGLTEEEPVVVEDVEVAEGEALEGEPEEDVEEGVEAVEIPSGDEEAPEEFVDAVGVLEDGEEEEAKTEEEVEGEEVKEEGNENDKETQTVFGYNPDDSMTGIIEELRNKRPHDDLVEPPEEVEVDGEVEEAVEEVKPGPPPPVVLKLHLVVETGTERIPVDLEITIDNLGAVVIPSSDQGSQRSVKEGEEVEEKTHETEMQTALSFYDTEQNPTETPELEVDAEPTTAVADKVPQDVDDYNFLGLLDAESIASDLSRDVFSPDLMTDEDLMVEPDLVPDQYVQALKPLSDNEILSWYGDESEFPDVAISRVNSLVKVSSTLQVIGPAQNHWGLVLPALADHANSTTNSFSGVSMVSTIHQLRHENAVSHLERIGIGDGSQSTASSFFSVNGEPVPGEIYAVKTRIIFQIRSAVDSQRSTDGRFTPATPINLHLETPVLPKPSMHVATVELGDDAASPSHVTFQEGSTRINADAVADTDAARRSSLLPGGVLEFSVDVEECPTTGGIRLVAQVDGEMLVEPIDVLEVTDRVMRLDNLEVTARMVTEPGERKSALKVPRKEDAKSALKEARVNALTCTLTTGPDGGSYTQAMEPDGSSPLEFYLPVAGGPVRATLAVIPQEEQEEPEEPEEEEVVVVDATEIEEVEMSQVEPVERDSQSEMLIGELLDEMIEEVGRTAHTPPSHPASSEVAVKTPTPASMPERVGVDGDRCRDRAYEMIVSALEAYEQGIAPLTDALLEISRKAKELGVAAADGEMPYESNTSLVSVHHCFCLDQEFPGCSPPSPKSYNGPAGFKQRSGDSRQFQGGGRRQQRFPRKQDSGPACCRQEGGGFKQQGASPGFRFGHQFYGVDRGSGVWGGRLDSSDECDLCRPRCSLPIMSPITSKARVPKTSGSISPKVSNQEPDSEPVEEPDDGTSDLQSGSTFIE